jgi:hypothetical protein
MLDSIELGFSAQSFGYDVTNDPPPPPPPPQTPHTQTKLAQLIVSGKPQDRLLSKF